MVLKNAIKENKGERKTNMILMEIKIILEVGEKGLNTESLEECIEMMDLFGRKLKGKNRGGNILATCKEMLVIC